MSSGLTDFLQFVMDRNFEKAKEEVRKKGKDIINTDKDNRNQTGLILASTNGDAKLVEYLLDNGADVHAKTANGSTALYAAAYSGHVEVIELLIKKGAVVDAENIGGFFPLYVAAQNSHAEAVKCLIKHGSNVNKKLDSGYFPLYYVSQEGIIAMVDLLIQLGANINEKCANADGTFALYAAAARAQMAVIKLLVEKNADINLQSKTGHTALYIAAQNGHKHVVEYLTSLGADINARSNDGFIALHIAAQNGHVSILEHLIKHGSNVDDVNQPRTNINMHIEEEENNENNNNSMDSNNITSSSTSTSPRTRNRNRNRNRNSNISTSTSTSTSMDVDNNNNNNNNDDNNESIYDRVRSRHSNSRRRQQSPQSADLPSTPAQLAISKVSIATNSFSVANKLDSSGTFYKGELNNRSVVIKKCNSASSSSSRSNSNNSNSNSNSSISSSSSSSRFGAANSFISEVSLFSFSHPNIIRTIGFTSQGIGRYLVLEFAQKGNLRDLLDRNGENAEVLTWTQREDIVVGILTGLEYLQSSSHNRDPFYHVTLNTTNVLLDENYQPKLSNLDDSYYRVNNSNNSSTSTSSSTSSNDMDIDSTSNGNSNGKDVDPLDSYMTNVRAEVSQLNSVGKKSDSTADSAKNAATAESVIDDDLDDAQLIFGREDEDDLQTMAKNMLVAAKKKELAQVDHSKINYAPFRKDFYKEVKEIADMTPKEVAEYRASLDNIKVTGEKCPKPVKNWAQCGLSSKTLAILTEKYNFTTPTPIQCQAIPAIMSGRDIIAIAKTGSGKTLAFLLPMIRHILDQPARGPFEGPIAVILTPTRELATQIYSECKKFAKPSDLQTVCLYGGSDISEQIADLKRGADIVVCTPGRMIDMLAANSGRVINLRRTTYLVLDEADKMFDMGFEPQVMRIIDNIRPDRQTVLFSATFLRSMEALARKILHKPLEIIVGGRSIVSKDVTQEVIVIEENQKYFKLLEYLGIWQEKGSVLVFVERQEAADLLLKELFSSGYPCMSLHAGMDQGDRDSALVDFKNHDVRLLIATSVASRGLDVKELNLVVNYDVPNHYEDYVHRVGRTGRAGRKGTAVTFITPEQGRLAGDIIQALEASGTTPPKELTDLLKKYKEEKATGKAQASRFSVRHGKGYSFSEEENKKREEMRKMQKAAFGIQDSDDEDDSKQSNEASFEDEEMDDDIEKKLKANKVVISAPSASTTSTTTTTTTTATSTTTTTTTTTTATPTTTSSDAASTSTFSSGSAVPTASAAAASAAQRAKEIALQLSRNKQLISETSSTAATVVVEPPVPTLKLVEELEINDFPQRARWRVTQKESVAAIQELSNASITVRGTHFPAGKVPQPPERKLYLVIEADNELSVQKARNEIKRIIKEEITKDNEATLRTDSARPAGRYQVL